MRRRRTSAEKVELYRIKFQSELWPAVAHAQGWDPRDKDRRRDLRARFWQEIGLFEKGDSMPITDAEFTAIKTYCLHRADEDNISRRIAWDNCRADFRRFNDARVADDHQQRAGVREYRERRTASGEPLDDPLDRKSTSHRLYRMREAARKAERCPEKKIIPRAVPDPDLIPF